METDSFFCQLLQQLPETLFDLLGLPLSRAASYRFDSVEVKKSLRIDGLFVPNEAHLPAYFVQIQFQRQPKFYANLFAKVFLYLETHEPNQEWMAVALFPSRAAEPKELKPYEDLLSSRRVRRFCLDQLEIPSQATMGLKLMQPVSAPALEMPELVVQLLIRARRQPDSELANKVVELVEELLIRRFTQLDREEIRRMFQLHDLRKSRVWQEAHEEGREEGLERGREQGLERGLEQELEQGLEQGLTNGKALAQQEMIHKMLSKGKLVKEIADDLDIPPAEVRRLAKRKGK